MYKLLGGLRNYLKWQEIQTDCVLFRMHNLFTTALLMACSLVITATQYVGNPIQCIVSGLPTHVINTFCWITSTFTMPDAFRREVGTEVAHPGVSNDFGDFEARRYHTYYQWVCFVLFGQALLCYAPKFIWDSFEGGLMQTLVMGLNIGICTEDEKNKKKGVLIDYLMKHIKVSRLIILLKQVVLFIFLYSNAILSNYGNACFHFCLSHRRTLKLFPSETSLLTFFQILFRHFYFTVIKKSLRKKLKLSKVPLIFTVYKFAYVDIGVNVPIFYNNPYLVKVLCVFLVLCLSLSFQSFVTVFIYFYYVF